MKKQTILLLLSGSLLAVSLANCAGDSAVDYGHFVRRVKLNDLDTMVSIPTDMHFFKANPCVVYTPIDQYQYYYSSYTMSVKRSSSSIYTFTNLINNEKATLDASSGKLTYNAFSKFMSYDSIPHQEILSNALRFAPVENECTYQTGNAYTINLSDYNLKPYKDGDDYYLPLDVLMRIDPLGTKGTAYYDGDKNVTYLTAENMEDYTGTKITNYPKSFYEYSYNLFTFDVDFIFGLSGYNRPMRYNNNQSFIFNQNGSRKTFEKYQSAITSAATTLEFDVAFDKMFDEIDDGGHTTVRSASLATDTKSLPESFRKHKEREATFTSFNEENKARKAADKEQKLDYNISSFDADGKEGDDIGYVFISGFKQTGIEAIQNVIPTANAIFNKNINTNSQIKDIVIDIANNTGGSTGAEGIFLSWICGKAKQVLRDAKDHSVTTTTVQYDINSDNVIDAKDSIPSDVNIYILTDATFSAACALAFDTYMYTLTDEYKASGKNITFIGRPNRGGACSITDSMLMPTGFTYHMSSNAVGVDWRDYSKTCDEIMPIADEWLMTPAQIANRTGYINPKIVNKRK